VTFLSKKNTDYVYKIHGNFIGHDTVFCLSNAVHDFLKRLTYALVLCLFIN